MRPGLRVGDHITLRDDHGSKAKVVMLSGSTVTALLENGDTVALAFGEFYDKTGDGHVPRTTPARPIRVDDNELAIAKELAEHLHEVKTGIRTGKEFPRPGYDPTTTSVRDRELQKVAEFAELPEGDPWYGMSLGTLRRNRTRYKSGGVTALIDGRSIKEKKLYGRQQEALILLMKEQLADQANDATVSFRTFYRRLQRRIDEYNETQELAETGEPQVDCPSDATVRRIVKGLPEGRYAFGDATRRRSNNSSPFSNMTPFYASRPGDEVQIDSTKLNCKVRGRTKEESSFRPELTVAMDVATRAVVGYRLTQEATNAEDASEVLARILTPEPFRDGWEDRLRYSYESVPHERAVSLDKRLEAAARVPVIFPNNIVIDNGQTFVSRVFFDACEQFGISIHRARPATGHDKANVERFFRGLDSRFLEYLGRAYTGRAVHMKGHDEPTQTEMYTLQQLDDLFAEFIVNYHEMEHDSLRLPWDEETRISPNAMYEFLVGAHGYLPAPASFSESVMVLPSFTAQVHAYGVQRNGRLFDSPALDRCRNIVNKNSKNGEWRFRFHSDEPRYIYFYDDEQDLVLSIPWTMNDKVTYEFSEEAWKQALNLTRKTDAWAKRQRDALDHLEEINDKLMDGKTGSARPRNKQHQEDLESSEFEEAPMAEAQDTAGMSEEDYMKEMDAA